MSDVTIAFYSCQVPPEMSADHTSKGGKGIWMKAAELPSGEQLRLMIGNEPTTYPYVLAAYKLHVSMSVGLKTVLEPIRRPSDEESESALSLWPDKKFEEDESGDPKVRHFWET